MPDIYYEGKCYMTPNEILDHCSESEKQELLELLGSGDGFEFDEFVSTLHEEFIDSLYDLSEGYHKLSMNDIETIKGIAKTI